MDRLCPQPKALKVKLDLQVQERLKWDQGSGSSAGGSQKKRTSVVRRETEECESCRRNDMDVDMDENKEELSFIPSAVSSSAAWYEPQLRCDRQRWEKGCQCYGIAPVMVADKRAPHTTSLFQKNLQKVARRAHVGSNTLRLSKAGDLPSNGPMSGDVNLSSEVHEGQMRAEAFCTGKCGLLEKRLTYSFWKGPDSTNQPEKG